MRFELFPYSKPFNMMLSIRILRPVNLRLSVFDSETKRLYIDRNLRLKVSKHVLVKIPIAPDKLTAEVVDQNLPRANSAFVIEQIKVVPDTKCPIELTESDKAFIRFAKWFSTESTRLQAGEKGTLYSSEGFSILFVDVILDGMIQLTTPARIARNSGVIEVSKRMTTDYSVPMLIVMLLHEYAHKYKNKEYGKEDSNELTADLIACHIALNLGFDAQEVLEAFRSVFEKKDTSLNRKRMAAIKEFAEIFAKSETKRCKR